jgi:mRNA interferase MazF
MAFAVGDVVLVPFPFTNQTASKKRPAVIVSNVAYNQAKPDVILTAVTTQLRLTPALGEVSITEWEAAGLLKPSSIKPVFATVDQRLIIRQLGKLAVADQAQLRKMIAETLG